MNTKNIEDRAERKEAKREARAEAQPIAPRPACEARGSNKRKV